MPRRPSAQPRKPPRGAGVGYKNTVARNLFTQHWARNPVWGAPVELALYNNISYNGTDNSHGYSSLPAFFGDMDGEGNPALAGSAGRVGQVEAKVTLMLWILGVIVTLHALTIGLLLQVLLRLP